MKLFIDMATLTKLIRMFEPVYGDPMHGLQKRKEKLPALESEIIPCLNCGERNVRKAIGQIVRFCSKECKRSFNRRNK